MMLVKLIVYGVDCVEVLVWVWCVLNEFGVEGLVMVILFYCVVVFDLVFIGDVNGFLVYICWIEIEWNNIIEFFIDGEFFDEDVWLC